MPTEPVFTLSYFVAKLQELRAERERQVALARDVNGPRPALSRADRAKVLLKTGRRCHICGGTIRPREAWEADHILAHGIGGKHTADNYLPAHPICNNYRWYYQAEEFEWILKLGVWMRTQVERETPIGHDAAEKFCAHERRLRLRRAKS